VCGLAVSKAGTRADGSPVIAGYRLTETTPWLFPAFVPSGKGQYGEWDFNKVLEFDWRYFLATLPAEHFDALFSEDVLDVRMSVCGAGGRWFAKGADYELIVWTSSKRAHMRADSKGKLAFSIEEIREPVARAGPSIGMQAAGWPRNIDQGFVAC